MEEEKVIQFYGASWCGDCFRSKAFLDSKDIQYEYIDIDRNPEAAEYVEKINNGQRSIPTIIFPDGSKLVEPSNQELGEKLGL